MVDLSGIPKSERELFAKNEEMIRRLLDRQLELMQLKEDLPVSDKTGRNKLQKEYGKINRWLGDLYQAPETYADVNIEGITNKQLGERIHSHTRKVMDQWALDTRKSSQGGSSIHHGDSTMQTLGAVKTASPSMRRDIIQAIKDRGKELATGKGGKNFFDVSEETHPLYHPGEGGKVDYKNKLSTIQMMPETATLDERLAALEKSTSISTAASEAADMSIPALKRKAQFLNAIIAAGGQEILDRFGDPFDRDIRTIEGIKALRPYLQKGLFIQSGGGVNLNAGFGLEAMKMLDDLLADTIRNPGAKAAGALMEAYNKETIQKLEQGDVLGAAIDVGTGAVAGGLVEKGVQKLGLSKAVGAVAAPIAGAGLIMEGMEGSTTDYLIKKYGPKIGMTQNRPAWASLSEMVPQPTEDQKPAHVKAVETTLKSIGGAIQLGFQRVLQEVTRTPKKTNLSDVKFSEGGF